MCACLVRFPILFAALLASAGAHAQALPAGQRSLARPRLIIRANDIPRLRQACGIGPRVRSGSGVDDFGGRAAEFDRLRAHMAVGSAQFAMPGDTAGAAFLLLMRPDDPDADRWRAFIETQLKQPILMTTDLLELVIAVDWSWAALDPQVRLDFIRNARDAADPLSPSVSPLDHRVFRRKLAALALAIAVNPSEHTSPAWAAQRVRLVQAAASYFKDTFPTYLAWRGLCPTIPSAAAEEESDAALALDLAGVLTGSDLWSANRGTVARWMEHYVLSGASHPASQHQFLHDGAGSGPLTPCAKWADLMPVTAHLIAARTGDAAAVYMAERVAEKMKSDSDRSGAWSWVPIALDTRRFDRVDPLKLPAARNLNGAVIFRGNDPRFPTAVWIEACQPYLRGDQHFDAGNFLFVGDGQLTVNAGDDIALEATRSKAGGQFLGTGKAPFDFSQFATATIAHNCMVVWDATHLPRWRGRAYACRGGQRPVTGNCHDFSGELDRGERATGSLLAYGYDDMIAYAALDLQSAYSDRLTERITREYVFFWDRALLVIDRVRTAGSAGVPIFVINLPARPRVDGDDLSEQKRSAGPTNNAGIWKYDSPARLGWSDRDGRMQALLLLPRERNVYLAGGPSTREVVPAGPATGRTYIGGESDSFERLISPAAMHAPQNAWFTLGEPTLLGPQVGRTPLWGRMEVRAANRSRAQVFAALLIASPSRDSTTATAEISHAEDRIEIRIVYGRKTAVLSLSDAAQIGGEITFGDVHPYKATLPTTVQPDPPLARMTHR